MKIEQWLFEWLPVRKTLGSDDIAFWIWNCPKCQVGYRERHLVAKEDGLHCPRCDSKAGPKE